MEHIELWSNCESQRENPVWEKSWMLWIRCSWNKINHKQHENELINEQCFLFMAGNHIPTSVCGTITSSQIDCCHSRYSKDFIGITVMHLSSKTNIRVTAHLYGLTHLWENKEGKRKDLPKMCTYVVWERFCLSNRDVRWWADFRDLVTFCKSKEWKDPAATSYKGY